MMTESTTASAPVTVSLNVVWQGSTGKEDARMSEISMDGCFIDSRVQGRALGDMVDFKVHLPDGPWVSLKGELVVEDYPMGFGLRFDGLTDSDRRMLAELIVAHGGRAGQELSALSAKEAIPTQSSPASSRRILLADDDALTLRMLTAISQSEGYTVVAAGDGREALRCLQQDGSFSAAIFDMKMPHLEGLDLILFMKADQTLQRIPVGMITAERDPKVWDDSVAAGVRVFLPKPFTPAQVQMMLRMLAFAGAGVQAPQSET
jgi:CheY-like chemotaxis protein